MKAMLARAVMLWLLLLGLAVAQEGDVKDQKRLIELVAKWMVEQGATDAAGQLVTRYGQKTIIFAPPPPGSNGGFDPRTGKIHIDPEWCNRTFLGPQRVVVFDAVPSLSSTVQHELTHQNQDPWAWKASVNSELAGKGNACEVEAWKVGFEALERDVLRFKQQLDSSSHLSWTERADIAGRLEKVCQLFVGYHASYVDEGHVQRYGPLPGLEARDGFPRSFEEVLADVRGIRKLAQDTIKNAEAYTGKENLGSQFPRPARPQAQGRFPAAGQRRVYAGSYSLVARKNDYQHVELGGEIQVEVARSSVGLVYRASNGSWQEVPRSGSLSWECANGDYRWSYTGHLSEDGSRLEVTVQVYEKANLGYETARFSLKRN